MMPAKRKEDQSCLPADEHNYKPGTHLHSDEHTAHITLALLHYTLFEDNMPLPLMWYEFN